MNGAFYQSLYESMYASRDDNGRDRVDGRSSSVSSQDRPPGAASYSRGWSYAADSVSGRAPHSIKIYNGTNVSPVHRG